MTKKEILYLFKNIAILLLPFGLILYLVELFFSFIFPENTISGFNELITKTITLIIVIKTIPLIRKETKKTYTQNDLVSGIYLTFNAVIFVFLSFVMLYSVDIIFNYIESNDLFSFRNINSMSVNLIIITILVLINLTKNIKSLD
jgi:hypothetical protein